MRHASRRRDKPYLRIQVLHKGGLFPQALEAIRAEIAPDHKLDVSARVRLARIAQDANASRLANEILAPALEGLENREELESALATVYKTGAADLEERVARRLGELFPGSSSLRSRHHHKLLAAGDYAAVAAMAADEPNSQDSVEFYSRLAQFLTIPDVPDYYALIASAQGDTVKADAYRMACVSDALGRKLILPAFELVLPIPRTPAQMEHGERLLLQVLEAILLYSDEDGVHWPKERVQAAVLTLIERLANPGNHALRFGLVQLMQPSVAGTIGMALVASLVLSLAARPVRLQN